MKAISVTRAGRIQLRPRKLYTFPESVVVFINRVDRGNRIRIAGINHQTGNVKGRAQLVEIGPSGTGKENCAYCVVNPLERQGELVGVDFTLFIRRVRFHQRIKFRIQFSQARQPAGKNVSGIRYHDGIRHRQGGQVNYVIAACHKSVCLRC